MFKHFISCLTTKYARFSGRASRSEYCGYMIVYLIIKAVSALIESLNIGVINIASIILGVLLIMPTTSIISRRLHDIGYSSWWFFAPLFFSLVLILLGGGVIGGAGILIACVLFFIMLGLMFTKGNKEENKYGLPPE
ncbi:DUF805 domain-containing protein [Escherichia coli]|uniref:DUF805 domain-containing protein n=1 Tax=Escherichia coli TaxID=562 RepID=UPI002040256C|nr:DUF805 domain-containing protein [Escherichia coli]MCM2691599.1 DUF805 domain-containing protein [Escherichia coli]